MRHNRITTHSSDAKLERLLRDILAEARANRLRSSPGFKVRRTAHGTTVSVGRSRGGSSVAVKQFGVAEEHYNYLVCYEWNDATQRVVDTPTLVAKPYDLRMYYQTPAPGGVPDVTTITWGYKVVTSLIPSSGEGGFYKNARFISFDGAGVASLIKTYYEYVDAPYIGGISAATDNSFGINLLPAPSDPLPDGWTEDQRFLITAVKPANGVGTVSPDIGGNPNDVDGIEWMDLNVSARRWHKELEVCDNGITRYLRVPGSVIAASPAIPRP